jgi:hypothetical protein
MVIYLGCRFHERRLFALKDPVNVQQYLYAFFRFSQSKDIVRIECGAESRFLGSAPCCYPFSQNNGRYYCIYPEGRLGNAVQEGRGRGVLRHMLCALKEKA